MRRFETTFAGRRMFGLTLSLAVTIFFTTATASAQPISVGKSKKNDGMLSVGDRAPDFELPIQGAGGFVSLDDLVKDGPVVVVVLRGFPGYQCGLCNQQVGSLMNRARALGDSLGNKPRRVVLVYPGPELNLERHAKEFVGSRRIPELFVMVRDPGMEMISQWGLRWDARNETAYPATFVIGKDKRVQWAKVSKSHGGRASADAVIRAVNQL